jgi:D-serine deaminase-like pyridoxal phosphate-dependent protein
VVRRKRLDVEHVEPGAGNRVAAESLDERGFVDQRPARGVDQVGGRPHQGEFVRAHDAARSVAELEVHRNDVGRREQLMLVDESHANLGSTLGLKVLAPGDDVHPEREPDLRDLGTELPEPDNAEPGARELEADSALPTALANPAVFDADLPGEGKHQAPRQFRRRAAQTRRSSHLDPELVACIEVDRGVGHASGDEQLQVGRLREHGAREGRALAHRNDDLGVEQRGDEIRVAQMPGAYVEIEPEVGEVAPGTEFAGDVLVVVENKHSFAHGSILVSPATGRVAGPYSVTVPVNAEPEDELLDWRWKGFPAVPADTLVSEFVASRPSLFTAGFTWPVATLRASAVAHNIGVLAAWCERNGILLAPHGKTTMAPALFSRQLDAGAWAITAATPWQVRVYRARGIKRVLLANELVDAEFVTWLAAERAADPDFEFLCYVDSVAGVEILGDALDALDNLDVVQLPLGVLVEVGPAGGRTGCRTLADVQAVAKAVQAHRSLMLIGVAGFEGVFGHGRDDATLGEVRAFVETLARTMLDLDADGLLDDRSPYFVLTCGGSEQLDVVTSVLREPLACSRPVRAVLRSGAYVTHDHGLYAATSPLAAQLQPAIEVWCQVLSRPEPTLALLGAGRRDVSFDAGLPVALWRRSVRGGDVVPFGATVSKLNDQHAFLDVGAAEVLEVGDLVGLGISHPCTTHDKWQLMPLLDDERQVIDCVRTYF